MTLTDRGRRAYRSHRADGQPARYAFYLARRDDVAEALLTWDYDEAGEFYDVDVDQLRALAEISLPPGAQARVHLHLDDDAWNRWGDEVDYSHEDIAAAERDAWTFYGVEVLVTDHTGHEASFAVWGFPIGDYWPGSVAGQVWEAAHDLFPDALHELSSTSPDLSATFADTLPGMPS